ncbi:MAG: hypothetical protein Q9169_007034 [Polycauliona sp. 2 TL-2023]
MMGLEFTIQSYKSEIAQLEARLEELRSSLAKAEDAQQKHRQVEDADNHSPTDRSCRPMVAPEDGVSELDRAHKWPLEAEEYKRYGRHLILDRIGLQGQLNLKGASVLIVGMGGLGSPAAAYLAGAGVGTIGLMDGDVVELSNLHRQIIHSTSTVGKSKVDSAVQYLQSLNPLPKYRTHPEFISPGNAIGLFEQYDLILDCTDRPSTRYLISDAAVLTGKPLISASALGMEGQLLVLNDMWETNHGQPGRYCYRCVFPKPPPADTVLTCGEGGILGPVVGVMGVLMATAALKILIRGDSHPSSSSDPNFGAPPEQPSMLLYSAMSEPMFRNVRIKGRRGNCSACSNEATITRESLMSGTFDYARFCGLKSLVEAVAYNQSVRPAEYARLIKECSPHQRKNMVIIDVRSKTEYELGHIEESISWPIHAIFKKSTIQHRSSEDHSLTPKSLRSQGQSWEEVAIPPDAKRAFTICRHGNDSQLAAKLLRTQGTEFDHIIDIKGGLEAWRKEVDPTFPSY